MSYFSTGTIEATSGASWFAPDRRAAAPAVHLPLPGTRHASRVSDLGLRLAGVVAICIAAVAIGWLRELVQIGVHHQATPLEYACAAIAVIGASIGGAMLVHGSSLLDEIDVHAQPGGAR